MNVLKRMYYAIFRPKKYPELIRIGIFRVILYGLFVSGLTAFLLIGMSYLTFRKSYGTLEQAIETSFPDFQIKNKQLYVEQPILYNANPIYVNVDTGEPGAFDGLSIDKISEMSRDYMSMLIADREKAVIYSGGRLMQLKFSDMNEQEVVTKQDILNEIPFIKGVIVAAMVFLTLFMMGFYLLFIAFVSLAETAFSQILGTKQKFGTIFKVAVHAGTPICLLFFISSVFGFNTEWFQWAMLLSFFLMIQTGLRHVHQKNIAQPAPMDTSSNQGAEPSFRENRERDANAKERERQYMEHKKESPDVIHPSSGWSFGQDQQTKE